MDCKLIMENWHILETQRSALHMLHTIPTAPMKMYCDNLVLECGVPVEAEIHILKVRAEFLKSLAFKWVATAVDY